jgi:nucleoside-diphosphate-sugar epimerase
VRDRDAVRAACDRDDVVLHNVAQVPLARARRRVHDRAHAGVAGGNEEVFGIPDSNPVTEDTPCRPLEAYGRAKLEAEVLCREAVASGLDVTIIRPRTILAAVAAPPAPDPITSTSASRRPGVLIEPLAA